MARVAQASVATGVSLNQDVVVGGVDYLTILAIAGSAGTPAAAAGDITIVVHPYTDDAANPAAVNPVSLPVLDTSNNLLQGGQASLLNRFRVTGLHKVQIVARNNNAGSLPVEINFDLG
jgi:hypothetical protein